MMYLPSDIELTLLMSPILPTACFIFELAVAKPNWLDIGKGLVPTSSLLNGEALYVGVGILGATCMPHSIFLGSATIQTRNYQRT